MTKKLLAIGVSCESDTNYYLPECVNDAYSMAQVHQHWIGGWDVMCLAGPIVTIPEIMEAAKWLSDAQVKKVSYSGHGTNVEYTDEGEVVKSKSGALYLGASTWGTVWPIDDTYGAYKARGMGSVIDLCNEFDVDELMLDTCMAGGAAHRSTRPPKADLGGAQTPRIKALPRGVLTRKTYKEDSDVEKVENWKKGQILSLACKRKQNALGALIHPYWSMGTNVSGFERGLSVFTYVYVNALTSRALGNFPRRAFKLPNIRTYMNKTIRKMSPYKQNPRIVAINERNTKRTIVI